MTEEQILNIWDRYYKVDPSRKNTKYGESGLGLPIVQQLVRLHKGKINVESELGKGTTFIISFPDVELLKTEENVWSQSVPDVFSLITHVETEGAHRDYQ